MSTAILKLKLISRRLGLTPILKHILGISPPAPIIIAAAPVPDIQPSPAASASDFTTADAAPTSYEQRALNEQARFATCENVHDLPAIFHYWSNKYLLPAIQRCGFSHPDMFFAMHMQKTFGEGETAHRRFISIGAGNCDTEVELAGILRKRGHENFTIECLDLNANMLARGEALAREKNLSAHLKFTRGDFNTWRAQEKYHAVIANQSLHHVTELEHLFDAIGEALHDGGVFITSDMIGRNGHQRWPEARAIVQEFWNELPQEKRYNLQVRRLENEFMDWDCSGESFEGIRSQDVLPELLARFEFEFFHAFGNVIDPFVDRSFGHHFNPQLGADREFIDRVQARDAAELAAGNITPTHMFAVLKNGVPGKCVNAFGRGPAESVRIPG